MRDFFVLFLLLGAGSLTPDRVQAEPGPSASVMAKPWTGAAIPYVIDAAFVNRTRLLDAMKVWQDATGVQFVERTSQANYIKVSSPSFGCNSFVGMKGGEQPVNLAASCSDRAVMHELGHAIGLNHEHTRLDRAQWVEIVRDNILVTCPFEADFALIAGSQDLLAYDFGSIMHYDGWSNTRRGKPTILTIPRGIPIGEGTKPSPSDIESVRRLYGKPARGTTVATFPDGLPIEVDGVTYQAPRTFSWDPGARHTIGVPGLIAVDANTRHVFARWSDNDAQAHGITVSGAVPVYTASFVRQHKIAAAMDFPGTGQLTLDPPSADGFYVAGSYVRIAAAAAPGRSFRGWTGIDKPNEGLYLEDEDEGYWGVNPRVFNVNGPKQITALTQAGSDMITVETDPPNLWVQIDGQDRGTPARMVWSPGSSHRLVVAQTKPACRAMCETGSRYMFQRWVGGNGSDPALNFVAPTTGTGPLTFTAQFKRQYSASVSILGSGSVELSPAPPADGFYDENTIVRFTPKPSAGNRFWDWFGMPANLDTLFFGDATTNVCASPLVYKMDRPFLAMAQMLPANPSGKKPVIAANAVGNAASGAAGGVSPGEIVVFYGANLGPSQLVPANTSPAAVFDNCLSRTLVYFDDVPAPVLYTLAGQVSVIVPYSVAGKTSTRVVLEYADNRSDAITLPVVAAKPGFFTLNRSGKGPGAFLHLDYQLVSDGNPVARGGYAQLYATGAGQTTPAGVDGASALDYQQLPRPVLPVKVLLGGVEAEVLYAGAAPNMVAGLLQVNIRVPEGAPAGAAVPVALQVGSFSSPDGVTMAIR